MRMAAQQEAEVVQTQAKKDTSEVIARTQKDLAELETTWANQREQIIAEAGLEISRLRSQILSIEREIKSKTSAECGKLEAESLAFAKQLQAEAKVEVAKHIADGKRTLGEAEGIAAQSFVALRGHEAEMSRLAILEKLVANEHIVVATTQENTMGLAEENRVVTQVTQQGLEAMRAKLAEITATSLSKLEMSGHKTK